MSTNLEKHLEDGRHDGDIIVDAEYAAMKRTQFEYREGLKAEIEATEAEIGRLVALRWKLFGRRFLAYIFGFTACLVYIYIALFTAHGVYTGLIAALLAGSLISLPIGRRAARDLDAHMMFCYFFEQQPAPLSGAYNASSPHLERIYQLLAHKNELLYRLTRKNHAIPNYQGRFFLLGFAIYIGMFILLVALVDMPVH